MRSLALVVVLLLPTHALTAQQPERPRCDTPEYRQFDFWVGDWVVTAEDGRVLGRNVITSVLDGCALLESWTGAAGGTGHSLNAWDRTTGKWRQLWIDNSGGRLELAGGLDEGAMVLSNETKRPDGQTVHQRVAFEPQKEGLRQIWSRSLDGGRTWQVLFDGIYRRERR